MSPSLPDVTSLSHVPALGPAGRRPGRKWVLPGPLPQCRDGR